MELNASGMTNYSTDPAAYLQRLTQGMANGSSGNSPQDVLKEVIGLISELLKQMQNGQGGESGGSGGMPGATGGAGGMPGGAGAMPGGAGGAGGGAGAAGGAGGGAGAAGGAGGGAGGTGGGMSVQNAAGVLASYMGQNGIDAEDPNAMYQLATNANGSTPPTVQQAAKTMLANPSAYQQIETHDVAGTDGKSGVSNFQWAAQGGLGAAGNATGGAGGAGGAIGAGGAGGAVGAGGAGGAVGAGGAGGTSGAGGTGGFGGTGGTGGTGGLGGVTGGLPASGMTAPVKPGTGDLVNDGKSMQMADEGKAMSDFNKQDGADFQAMESELSHGDGNAATKTLAKAVESGKLSQSDAAAIGSQLQQTANAHGGGKIDDESRDALKNALGGADVLTPGKSRLEVAFDHLTGMNTNSILGVSTK